MLNLFALPNCARKKVTAQYLMNFTGISCLDLKARTAVYFTTNSTTEKCCRGFEGEFLYDEKSNGYGLLKEASRSVFITALIHVTGA